MIILSEVSQRKANTACSHVYVESPKKQTELVKTETRNGGYQGPRVDIGERLLKGGQSCIQKVSKLWRSNEQNDYGHDSVL